jgi:hypothetical protein
MAKNPTLATACAAMDPNDIAALLEGGSLRLYAGQQPASPDVAVGTQLLLAELRFGTPAFLAAVGGTATAHALTSEDDAPASGYATWARASSASDVAIFDGSVGVHTDDEDFDCELDTVSIAAGSSVAISALTITV